MTELFDLPDGNTRRCRKCHEELPISMFYLEQEQRQKTLLPCRNCKRASNQAYLAPRRAIVDKMKTDAGCTDCGHRDDAHPEVFQYDHIDPNKKVADIARLITAGTWQEVLDEIAKCEVVCSNCHAIRTRARGRSDFGISHPGQVGSRGKIKHKRAAAMQNLDRADGLPFANLTE